MPSLRELPSYFGKIQHTEGTASACFCVILAILLSLLFHTGLIKDAQSNVVDVFSLFEINISD